MVGTEEEAKVAASFGYLPSAELAEGVLPDGWEWLGAGFSRAGYLSPSKVVYKVTYDGDYNTAEMKVLGAIAQMDLDDRVYVPKATLWGNVIAMEFVVGTPINGWDLDAAVGNFIKDDLDIQDNHDGNLRKMQDGRIAVIDFGCSRLGS